ncbi:MAG: signal peptidase II [Oligoflexus sp.]
MLKKWLEFPFLQNRSGRLMSFALVLVFIATVGLDQVTKRHAQATLLGWEHATDIRMYQPKFFEIGSVGEDRSHKDESSYFLRLKFHYQRNVGAAFSMFSNMDDKFRVPFFYMVTVIAIIFIAYYLKTLPLNFHLTRFGLVMILAGAIGNFIDRVLLGYVIDFVDVDWVLHRWRHDFAVFNVADIAINIGIISFILESILPIKPLMLEDVKETSANKKLSTSSSMS